MHILVIEDNVRLGELIARGLAARGFITELAADLDQAREALRHATYDALILDLGLPDGDGLAWLSKKRVGGDFPPVLVLTARDTLRDRIVGLDGGADDYLGKPADIDEIAARLRALLRRPGARSPVVIRVGDLTFDIASRTARGRKVDLELTRREADLLELLMRRAGAVVRKSTIGDALYSFNEPITPNAIEAIVSRLRQKLGSAGVTSQLITVRGLGYILKEPVS